MEAVLLRHDAADSRTYGKTQQRRNLTVCGMRSANVRHRPVERGTKRTKRAGGRSWQWPAAAEGCRPGVDGPRSARRGVVGRACEALASGANEDHGTNKNKNSPACNQKEGSCTMRGAIVRARLRGVEMSER